MSICTRALLTCECRPVAPGCERVIAVGEIDLSTGSRLTDALRGAQARAPSVVLDLSGVTFIDAGGARILLAADRHARAAAGTFAIAHPEPPVERVLQLVAADRTLVILRHDVPSPEPATPIRSAVRPAPARGHGYDDARSATARLG
jgi:anti-anti-sigma factor